MLCYASKTAFQVTLQPTAHRIRIRRTRHPPTVCDALTQVTFCDGATCPFYLHFYERATAAQQHIFLRNPDVLLLGAQEA